MENKNTFIGLFILFILIIFLPFITSTQVYDCNNGVKTYLGEFFGESPDCPAYVIASYGGCWCPNSPEDNLYLTSGYTGHCLPPSQEPLECSHKTITCYEAINGKCVSEAGYGECKYYSNLQDCVTYVNYYGGGINLTYIFLGSIFIILLIILIILVKRGKHKVHK